MELDSRLEWVAMRLGNVWIIRPKDRLGTCGWVNGVPWVAQFVKHKPANIPVVEY
jgi:hypothetical protein